MTKLKKILTILLLVTFMAGALSGCNVENKSFQSMEDFEQAKIGVLTGSSFDLLAKEYFPDASMLRYMNITDLILNLKQEKIDGILMDMCFFTPLAWEKEPVTYLEMDMPETEYAIAFPKTGGSTHLQNQINEFIDAKTESGWLAELQSKWFSLTEPDFSLDLSQLSGENGTLKVATTLESKPLCYLKDSKYNGLDAELIFNFAKEYGYALEIVPMDFGALFAALGSGTYDFALSSITVTEERKESVTFSNIYSKSGIVMAMLEPESEQITKLEQLENSTLGIVTGTTLDSVAQRLFPNAERKYFNTAADALLALGHGRVDAYFADKTVYAGMKWESAAIKCIDEPIENISNALILPKEGYNQQLLAQLNEFIAKAKSEGTLDYLNKKWFGDTEPSEHPDYTKLSGTNGTLKIAISDSMKPVSYKKGSLFTGYEVDFLTRFAEEYGYKLEMKGMAFDALISSVSLGACDIGAGGITITEERRESVTFTDPHFETYIVAVVKNNSPKVPEKTLADFENATIGIQTGAIYDSYAKELFPNANLQYYSLITDMILALSQNKIDGYMTDLVYIAASKWEGANIKAIDEVIDQTEAGFIFAKNNADSSALRDQMNEFLADAKQNGKLDTLKEKWFADEEPTEFFDMSLLAGENGTLEVAFCPELKPLSYYKGNTPVGYEIEVIQQFAFEYGYNLNLTPISFDAMLPGVVSGKYDIGTGGISITEERAESVDFSDPYLAVSVVMAVKDEQSDAEGGFFANLWQTVSESFNKTFIREDRWKLIVEGIGITMLISLCAALAGSLFGFGLYMLTRSDVKAIRNISKKVASVYSRIIAGTPVVVILMILFYVIFGKVRDISGVVVAIIGFALTFGAFIYDHMAVSVNSVPHGQVEAAYALGYTKNRTFFRIIFPQAMDIFLPSYCAQAVELIKATAVVGYIAVNDLTKMGDIIRSNTYEAFFPLIATAIIYFMLTWGLSSLLKLLKRRFEPGRRKNENILKGVKTV